MPVESTIPNDNEAESQTTNRGEETRSEESFVTPAVDIFEQEGGLTVLADVPGVEPSDLNIQIENGVLTLYGRARHSVQGQPLYREFHLSGFYRQFRLADELDNENVKAELKNGVLTLNMNRSARAEPRRIEVRTA